MESSSAPSIIRATLARDAFALEATRLGNDCVRNFVGFWHERAPDLTTDEVSEPRVDDVESTGSSVLQTFVLGVQWPTLDPFLFCAHHVDHYPAANARMGPAASLEGRQIGMDFAGKDGWNMYHGSDVPGFPQHPHRGFETVSYARSGLIDHADSMGAHARFGTGDVQWMTAGKGVVHSEMFPLFDQDSRNPLEMFQFWLNLPAADKMVDPYFTMFWDADIPKVRTVGDDTRQAVVTIIAGRFGDTDPRPPPPNSWAARAEADVAIWHVHLDAGAEVTIPAATGDGTNRVVYLFEGDGLDISGTLIRGSMGAVVIAARELTLVAPYAPAECMILQGRPIGEPVAQNGPFVMNTDAEVRQAFVDYRDTRFGGWPWPSDAPTHGFDRDRFADHGDGRAELSET